MDIGKLFEPFKPSLVSWRVGSMTKDKKKARALAYIDARDVMRRLDEVCGPANWQCRYPHANGKTVCEIGLKIDGEWVWKANGAGDTDIEAEKGAISDAFKRAAVLWGVGRYLYDLDSPWVEVNEFKQIDQREHARLERILSGARIESPDMPPHDEQKAPDLSLHEWTMQFRSQLQKCRTRFDVEAAWKNSAARRDAYGVQPGDDDFQRLSGFCKDRIEELGLA